MLRGSIDLAVCVLVGLIGPVLGGCLRRVPGGEGLLPTVQARVSARAEARQQQDPAPEQANIAGLKVSVWRPAAQGGPLPLVVFSHGFHGSSTQSTFLMRAIADDGFLVIAPNHQDAGRGRSFKPEAPLGRPSDWSDTTYLDRADDIRNLLKVLRNDPDWSRQIDWQRLALAGHSLGGYTVLGLAGGWPSWKLTGIKAVLALSPYSAPFQEHGDLASLGVPVMYQGGTRDIGITPFVARKGGAFDATSSPAWFVEFQGAGHLAWTDLNPRYHESVIHYSLAFLNRYVKGLGSTDMETRLPDVAELRSK